MEGYPFTWERRKGYANGVEERLDRALVSMDWLNIFSYVKLQNLESSMSDHSPILLDFVVTINLVRASRFRFENAWLHEKDCSEVVSHSWNASQGLSLSNKIENYGRDLFAWGG